MGKCRINTVTVSQTVSLGLNAADRSFRAVSLGPSAGNNANANVSVSLGAWASCVQPGTVSIRVPAAANIGFYANPVRASATPGPSTLVYDTTTNEIMATPPLQITGVTIADASYTPLDDTALGTTGGYVVITGTGFESGQYVELGSGIFATSAAVIGTTSIRASFPAVGSGSGTYTLKIYGLRGELATYPLVVSAFPAWSTGSNLGNVVSNVAFSIAVSATSDSNVSYANTTSLPPNTVVSSNGTVTGNIVGVPGDTTYTFGINATDLELQNTAQTFSMQYYAPGVVAANLMVSSSSAYQTIVSGRISGTTAAKAYGFGYNWYGELGTTTNNGTNAANQIPTNFLSQGSLAGKTVAQIACGAYHTVILATDSTVHTFGRNYYGELGTATNNGTATPNPVPTDISARGSLAGKTVSKIACGYTHTVVLATDGTVHTFGYNYYGALGTTTNSGTENANPAPVNISANGSLSGKTASQISAGYHHTVIVATDGTIHAFGINSYGQLGTSTNSGTNSANNTPLNISANGSLSGKTVSKIACGAYHTTVLATDATLHSFGNNYYGQLGTTTNNGSSTANPTPVNISSQGSVSGKTVAQISAGYWHTAVLATDSSVHTFGRNDIGQLGTTANSGVSSAANPVPLNISVNGSLAGKTVSTISTGWDHTVLAATDATIHAFGNNYYGQLGTPANIATSNPNPVPTNITPNFLP